MSKKLEDYSVVWDDEAIKALMQVRRYLSFAIELANKQNKTMGYPDARSLSHAKTKVDEALLWLCQGTHTVVDDMLGEYGNEHDNAQADIEYINEQFKLRPKTVNPLTGEKTD